MLVRRSLQIAVVAGLAGFASSAFAAPDAATDQAIWRELIHTNPAPANGCFHATYPSTQWVRGTCFPTPHRYMATPHRSANGQWETVGNGNDDVIQVGSNISQTVGSFPTVTGVKTEKGVGVAAFGGGGILGPNEYTLQINSQMNLATAACKNKSGCTVWQQYVYAPDYDVQGSAAVFIEYWLLGYGSSCPTSWDSDGSGDCVMNSNYVAAPDEPITQLGNEKLSGSAKAGGNDTIVFTVGSTAYTFSAPDSVLDLATAWNESEFNVVGNAGGSKAVFNSHSSVTVKIAVNDGSTAKPNCLKNSGTTGETNNLSLKTCTGYSASAPYIQFTESN
ncbi:MAG: hypothetical protein JSS44_03555 [Proteobacteria bacterium]|nr:hypothetical protein [Pseudomonadota bacterium]MBS0465502.1 hypothetical protein [Pseudomonadota bacterium]